MSTHRNPQKSPYPKNFSAENFSTSFPKSRRCIFFRLRIGLRCFFSNPRMGRSYIGELGKNLGPWGWGRNDPQKWCQGKKSVPYVPGRALACMRGRYMSTYACVYSHKQVGLWVYHIKALQHSSFLASDIHTIAVSISKENDTR